MKFNKVLNRQRMAKEFDLDESFTKQGKTMKYYDVVQTARNDTEIYPVLEKYGCIDKLIVDHTAMYDDFREFKNLRELKDKQIMAENMFNQLPAETKAKFGNSMHTFIKNGEKWLKAEIEKEQAKQPTVEQPTTEQPKGE